VRARHVRVRFFLRAVRSRATGFKTIRERNIEMKAAILCAIALPLVGACAAPGASTDEHQSSATYRTGSNIPTKERSGDGVVTVDKDSIQDQMVKKTTRPPGSSSN
jgi:hypothetical protein